MGALQVLNEILTKKDLSKDNRKRSAVALLELSVDTNNAKLVAEYLMKLHYSACPAYFNRAASSLTAEQLIAVVDAFLANDQFQKDKAQNFLYPKGFGSVLSLAKSGKHQLAFLILNYILSQSEKSGQFADGCKNNFRKSVIDTAGLASFQQLFEVVNSEAFEAKSFEKKRFERFLDAVVEKTITTAISATESSVAVAEPLTIANKEEVQPSVTKGEASVKNVGFRLPQTSITKIESTQSEILSTLRRLTENRTAIDTLALQLQKKDAEIAAAHTTIKEKEQRLSAITLEFKKSKDALANAEEKISDLTNRLRTSLNMDEISKNQELATLKNDISEALKLDYADFTGTKGSEYSQDLFEAYRSTLTRIFKLLKRFGITCE